MAKIKQNLDSWESKSASGTTLQGIPPIKGGSVVKSSAAESKYCCVCMTPRWKISNLVTRRNCPHKCCEPCKSGQCQQCTRSTKIESGPRSARVLVQSPTGGKKENDTERRTDSPEAKFIGNAKTTRSRKLKRSSSVGYSLDRATDMGDIDQRQERSGTNSQPLQKDYDCCICMDNIKDPKKLGCGHVFCKDCIDEAFKHQPKCPSCSQIFGMLKGNQPDGKMTVKREKSLYLEGYQGCGAIVITYDIPDGIQTADHPNPGQKFHGTTRTAYLPGNAEGEEVCNLLQKAFDAKLIFTVGKSNTTGRDNVVIWNYINHKTSSGGQYGYPDPTYLQRVKDELAAKGIKSDTAREASTPVGSHGISSTKPVNSTAGSAIGGYGVSSSSRWDDSGDYASLPITGANASLNVLSRDFGASSSPLVTRGMGSSSSYPFSNVAGVHTVSSRSSLAVSPVNSSSSYYVGSHLSLNSSSEKSTTRYNDPLRPSSSVYTPTASSISSSSSADGTGRYNLRSSSSTCNSTNKYLPSSFSRRF